MTNPVLVELTRGALVESVHTGAIAIAQPTGRMLLTIGDVARPVFPRSAIKAFQAIPLIETGAADHFAFDARELALSCASHSGDDRHADLAGAMLAKAGLSERDLGCGAHHAMDEGVARLQAAKGQRPSQLNNNCSGKHAGMLATCVHCGDVPEGYLTLDHPHQQRIALALADMCGDGFDAARLGRMGVRRQLGRCRWRASRQRSHVLSRVRHLTPSGGQHAPGLRLPAWLSRFTWRATSGSIPWRWRGHRAKCFSKSVLKAFIAALYPVVAWGLRSRLMMAASAPLKRSSRRCSIGCCRLNLTGLARLDRLQIGSGQRLARCV